MKVTFIIKKAAKRYDTESTATIYVRFRNGRQLDSVAPTQLSINPNLWDDKGECVKTKAVCDEDLRSSINGEIRNLKTFMEKSFQAEKDAIDKEWLKLTLDKYYHPEKYFIPEEVVIKPTWKIQCKLAPKTKRFCPLKTFNNAPLKSLDRWGYYYFSLFPL